MPSKLDVKARLGGIANGAGVVGSESTGYGVRRPEDTESASNRGDGAYGVSKTDAGSQLDGRRIPLGGLVAVDTRIHQTTAKRKAGRVSKACRSIDLNRKRLVTIETDGEVVVLLLQSRLVLDPKTQIEHELVVDTPVILYESTEVIEEELSLCGDGGGAVARDPQEHACHIVAGARCGIAGVRTIGEVWREREQEGAVGGESCLHRFAATEHRT